MQKAISRKEAQKAQEKSFPFLRLLRLFAAKTLSLLRRI